MAKKQYGHWNYPPEYHRRPVMRALTAKPHLVFRDGHWCLYRSWWKSLWATAACLTGSTIPELRNKLRKSPIRHRYQYRS